jgi:hypothetical protein
MIDRNQVVSRKRSRVFWNDKKEKQESTPFAGSNFNGSITGEDFQVKQTIENVWRSREVRISLCFGVMLAVCFWQHDRLTWQS